MVKSSCCGVGFINEIRMRFPCLIIAWKKTREVWRSYPSNYDCKSHRSNSIEMEGDERAMVLPGWSCASCGGSVDLASIYFAMQRTLWDFQTCEDQFHSTRLKLMYNVLKRELQFLPLSLTYIPLQHHNFLLVKANGKVCLLGTSFCSRVQLVQHALFVHHEPRSGMHSLLNFNLRKRMTVLFKKIRRINRNGSPAPCSQKQEGTSKKSLTGVLYERKYFFKFWSV